MSMAMVMPLVFMIENFCRSKIARQGAHEDLSSVVRWSVLQVRVYKLIDTILVPR